MRVIQGGRRAAPRPRNLFRDPVLGLYCGLLTLALLTVAEVADPSPLGDFLRPMPSAQLEGGAGAAGGPVDCRVGSVYDGDTLTLHCNGEKRRARLLGFDTPELGDAQCPEERRAALAARDALRQHIRGAKEITFGWRGTDRYGRDLVVLRIDGRDVASQMIAAGHARAYRGEKRRGWCDGLLPIR